MKRILTAIDFLDFSSEVIQTSVNLCKALKADLFLVHVESSPEEVGGGLVGDEFMYSGVDLEAIRESIEVRIEENEKILADFKERLDQQLDHVACGQLQGRAAEKIIEQAEKIEADLIIVGSHKHGTLYRLFFGTLYEDIIRHANCPVLVVPHEQD